MLTSQFGHGHWRPLAGLASVLVEAGHEVAFVTTPENCGHLVRHGFACFPVGLDDDGGVASDERSADAGSVDPAVEVWRHVFAGRRIEQMLPGMLATARAWRPDLIVREISEFSGALVGEQLDIPVAVLQVSCWRPEVYAAVGEALNRQRQRVGLPPVETQTYVEHWQLLSPEPPDYRYPGRLYPVATYPMQLPIYDAGSEHVERQETLRWTGRPRIFTTLGTAYNRYPELFEMILAAAGDLDVDLVMATGVDPAEAGLDRVPDNVLLRSYVPLSEILPTCDLVISHGGFGTFQAALRHSLPQVLIPLAADQPDNARHCEALGAGIVLWEGDRSAERLTVRIRTIRDDPSYRVAAQGWKQAINALPGPKAAIEILEDLAG